MLQRLRIQLPNWAQREHPILRYELNKSVRLTRRAQYVRALWIVLLTLALLVGGYLIATNLLTQSAGQNLTEALLAVVYWPLLAVQVAVQVVAVLMTANVVSEEKRRQTWDNLRATEGGAELVMRTRWAAVFYRLRLPLIVIAVVRALLILGILYDLTAFQGRYLDLLINGIVPDVALPVAAVLLAFFMTSSLLLPLTGVGFDSALGLLIASIFQHRTYAVLAQILLVGARVLLVGLLVFLATQFVNGDLETTDLAAWTLMGAFGAAGDWGLAFLNLGFYGEVWATIPFGIFMGLALLAFSMLQAMVTDWLLALAIRRAEGSG
ncbi:MAG: hypothetical protein K8L99_09150 [Anaerolineae bacterium]|nr:hypothetical protein [Anaerolineae bacterium]